MRQELERWPYAAIALREELGSHPGRFALIAHEGGALALERLATALRVEPLRVGAQLTEADAPPSEQEITDRLRRSQLLMDCEVLFDPELAIDVLALFRKLAKQGPLIAIWPGKIEGTRARYSEPGRRDHYDRELADTLLLYPRSVGFIDEVPYTIKRIP